MKVPVVRVVVAAIASALIVSLLPPSPRPTRAQELPLSDIPAAAWQRPFGAHPLGATGKNPPSDREPAQSRTKRGIPVGGIGTGSFMYNLAGTFGPWEFDIGGDDSRGADWGVEANRGHEERFLDSAAFHVYVRSGATRIVRTLATEDVLPAWPRMERGSGTYSALFPKAWFEYEGLPVELAMEQFSPFVAGNYRLSSLPVGLFRFAVENPSTEPADVAVMFTWPNAIYRQDTADYTYPRMGLSSEVVEEGSTIGVSLRADDPQNVPETQKTEWFVAADASDAIGSYTQDWSADGLGADVIGDFSDDGQLSNVPLDPRRRGQAGAVALQVTLQPGERAELPFSLAWDFPVVQFKNTTTGTKWRKRYKEWFPGRFRAGDMAKLALDRAQQWEDAIDEWWEPVALEARYPLWLRRAALNELYYDVFGGVFWESGVIDRRKRFGARPGQNLYFTHEANVYQDAETFDVRHWETRHLLELFPKIERDVLLAWADFIMDDPDGKTPHDAGTPANDPYFVYGHYSRTSRGEKPPDMEWRGLPSRFAQQAHAYWSETRDRRFLREVWPAAVRTMAYLKTKDVDRDGLPEGGSGPEGASFKGESVVVATLYIGALEAMADMASDLHRKRAARSYRRLANKARRRAERIFWSPRLGYYRFATGGANANSLQTIALGGQRYPEVHGLPPVLRRARMRRHLWKVYRRAALPFGRGRIGVVNGVSKRGKRLKDKQMGEVWPGSTYYVAALMYRAGRAANDAALKRAALKMAHGAYRLTYESNRTAYWFDTPEAWSSYDVTKYRAQQYQRPRAVWELLLELKNPFD